MKLSTRYILIILIYCTTSQLTYAQLEQNTWFFGGYTLNTRAGIQFDFLTNQPTPYNEVRYPLSLQENNIIVSNPNTGDVVFYSDGQMIIDATHAPMPNGTDLNGSPSTMYGTSIVFDPSGCNRYLLITVQSEEDAIPRKIYYSAVDLSIPGNGSINNPFGDVDGTVKNIDFTPIGVDCTEGIFAIPKSGTTKDSWLFFGDRNQPVLYLYQITSSGISFFDQFNLKTLMPTLPPGDLVTIKMDFFPLSDTSGRLVIAPGRNTNQAIYPLASFIFNTKNGSIEQNSYQLIVDKTYFTYGTAFSPDGSKLYLSDYVGKTLKQFDYNTGSLSTIGTSPHNGRSGGLKTGPDGKVYWANAFVINSTATPISRLSVVNQPNQAGPACSLSINSWIIGANINPKIIGALPTYGTFPNPSFVLPISPDNCALGNGSAIIDPAGSTAPLQYQWDNGETTAMAINLTGGLHHATITDGLGCEIILEVFIEEGSDAIVPEITGNLIICEMGNITTILEGEGGFENYLWSNGETTQSVIIDMPGVYTLMVTSAGDCTGQASIEVFEESLDVEINGDSILCDGNNDFTTLEIEEGFDHYIWSDQSIGSSLSVNQAGIYSVTVTNTDGCVAIDSISISSTLAPQIVDLPSLIEIDFGESIYLNPTIISNSSFTIQWTPSDYLNCQDCPSPTIEQPIDNQIYQILIWDNFGCMDSASVIIRVLSDKNVYVPNIFSPNGDGTNDIFTIYGMPSLKVIRKLQIFSRWGELIFEAKDFPPNNENFGWYGEFKGNKMNPAVFAWLAEVEFFDGSIKILNGDLVLIR